MFVSSVNRLLGAVLVFTLLGCVPATQTGTSYSRGEARTVQQVQIGKVIEVTEITIEGTKSGAGGLVGGAVGGIAGGSTGSGAGGEIAAVLAGAVSATGEGHRIFGADAVALDELGTRLRAALGDDDYRAASERGAALDGAAAVEHALRAL